MDAHEALTELAIAWRPQRPGRRSVKDIVDPLVEPDWNGLRVVAAISPERATIVHDGEAIAGPDDLAQGLLDGFSAIGALVEGSLTTIALHSGEGVVPTAPKVERPPILVPRFIRPNVEDDPYVRARDHESRTRGIEPRVLEALAAGRAPRLRRDRPAVAGRRAARRRPAPGAEAAPGGGPRAVVPRPDLART